MVVFNCNACGESLKKNQVEKHYLTVCRRCEVLSCVDCGKDFWGDGYKEHTKCISEEEKYSGKNYKPKPNANKGEAKQEAWLEKVQAAIDTAKPEPRVKHLLETLKDYPNIPRKKAKFENFLGNSLRVRDRVLSAKVWDLLMTTIVKEDSSVPTQNNNKVERVEGGEHGEDPTKTRDSPPTNNNKTKQRKEDSGTENITDKSTVSANRCRKDKKKKKRKHKEEETNGEGGVDNVIDTGSERISGKRKSEESCMLETSLTEDVSEMAEDTPCDKKRKIHFDWSEVICSVLRSKADQEISIKKLKKKVIAEYLSRGGFVKSEEKLWAKFQKKVNKNPNVKVLKDRVRLVE